jgi:toxin CptA
MSIAVSVIVRPSSVLRLAHAGLCACVVASAAVCPGVVAPLLCVLAGVLAWFCGRPGAIVCQFDLIGVGRLRLTVYQQTGTTPHLLDGSTLWPNLLLLRLGGDDGRAQVLAVLPDSVARPEWRALALACRAAAAHAEIKTPAL